MADVTISNLKANETALDGTELFEIVNADGNSRKELLSGITTFVLGGAVESVSTLGTKVNGLLIAVDNKDANNPVVDLSGTLGSVSLTTQVTGTLPVANGGTGITNDVTIVTIPFIIDGGGVTITTGLKGYLPVDFGCTIQSVTLLGDQTGSIVVNIWKTTYSSFDPPTTPSSTDKITASAPPTITTAKKSQDSTLTGWNTTISAGDILAFNVDSVTTMTRVTLALKVKRT